MKPLSGLPVDSFLQVSKEANIPLKSLLELVQQVENGASAAFLARYRADLCEGLDEIQVHSLLDKLRDCQEFLDRRLSMVTTLSRRGDLTEELKAQFQSASDRHELDDIFMPFRPRLHSASDPVQAAIKQGLDPLARALWFQQEDVDIQAEARNYADPERDVPDADHALAGACVIAARWLSEKPEILRELRKLFRRDCELSVTARPATGKDQRLQALDGYRAKAAEVPWQKRLSIRRGVRTGKLSVKVEMPLASASRYLERCLIKDPKSPYAPHLERVVSAAISDGMPERVKNAVLQQIDEKADREATASLQAAVRETLLGPTAHGLRIVGIETGRPGGWRAALIDGDGEVVHFAVVREDERAARQRAAGSAGSAGQALAPAEKSAGAAASGQEPPADASQPESDPAGQPAAKEPPNTPPASARPALGKSKPGRRAKGTPHVELSEFLRDRDVDLIVYTSGPRLHETERFIRSHIRRCGKSQIAWQAVRDRKVWMYARSKTSRLEFPRLEPAVRSAISLARRVQDPMAELVKADPVTIGPGFSFNELNSDRLRRTLRSTVDCVVHEVGVDANRASVHLLALVPGFDWRLAKRVVAHRRQNGPFRRREDLRKVDGVSAKIFAQAVGFLRVRGDDPLDTTGAHPEYRELHEQIAAAAECDLAGLLAEPERLDGIDPEQFATEERSVLFVKAAIEELRPARRKPRPEYQLPRPVVPLRSQAELKPNVKIGGVVSSVSDFGAWVDIGGDKDALLHVSQIRVEHVQDSKPAFKQGDQVEIYIRPGADSNGRISLTMWNPRSRPPRGRFGGGGPGRRPFSGQQGRGGRDFRRSGRRKPLKRTFGPDQGPRGRRGRPHRKLSLEEKLDMLQNKYRTKI